jgi:hypothetical protein
VTVARRVADALKLTVAACGETGGQPQIVAGPPGPFMERAIGRPRSRFHVGGASDPDQTGEDG